MPVQTKKIFSLCVLLVAFGFGFAEKSCAVDTPLLFPEYHHRWASSLPGKTNQLLFLVNANEIQDAHEIAWQIDATSKFVVVEDSSDETASDDLLRRDWSRIDGVVLSRSVWDTFEEPLQKMVLDYLTEGGALVLLETGATAADALMEVPHSVLPTPKTLKAREAIPYQVFSAPSAHTWKVGSRGKGRVAYGSTSARSIHHGLLPIEHRVGIDIRFIYDYHVGQVVRAITWALDIKQSFRIHRFERLEEEPPDANQIPPQLPVEFMEYMNDARLRTTMSVFRLQLMEPASDDVTISLRVRHPFRDQQWELPHAITIAKGDLSGFLILPMGRGDACIDAWIEHRGDVMDWASLGVHRDLWPMLGDVSFSKTVVQPNDSLEVSFTVRKNLFQPANTFAHIVVSDPLGREIAHKVKSINAEGDPVRARIGWSDALTTSLSVDMYLLEHQIKQLTPWDKQQASFAGTKLSVTPDSVNGIEWVVSDTARNEPESYRRLHTLRGLGVDAMLANQSADVQSVATESDLNIRVNHGGLTARSAKGAEIREPCLTSLEWRQSQYDTMGDWSQWSRTLGVTHTILGDINSLNHREDCASPSCRLTFQNNVRSYYPNLRELNKSWVTKHLDWASISPPENTASEAMRTDYKRSRAEIYESAQADLASMVLEFHDDAQYSVWLHETLPPTDTKHTPSESIVPDSSSLALAKLRSYSHAQTSRSVALSSDGENIGHHVWRAAFQRTNSILTPAYGGIENNNQLAEVSSALDKLRTGIDTLLLQSEEAIPDVAIYENATTYFSASESEHKRLVDRQRSLVAALDSAGISYQFVHYGTLMDTGLSNYKVALLPHVLSLSEEEIQALNHFRESGGEVLATEDTASLDQHGLPVSADRLKSKPLWSEKDDRTRITQLIDSGTIISQNPAMVKPLKEDTMLNWRRYRFDTSELLCAIQYPNGRSAKPALRIPDGSWAYDIQEGELLKSKKARVQLNDWGGAVISILPYRISRLIVNTSELVTAGSRLAVEVEVKTLDDLPGTHWIGLSLFDSDEQELMHYRKQFACENGAGSSYLPLALNDRPGTYTLVVRDLLSGTKNEATIEIRSYVPN